jgi:uncharacterized protein (TIGR03083 family)
MASTPALPYDPLYHLRTDGVRLLEIVTDHGFDPAIPACPGWDLGDLAWHVGTVWNRFAQVVAGGFTTTEQYRAVERPARPDGELLVDWVTAAHTALYSALARADPDDEIATWAGPQDVHWVLRRMTQETAVHRWDASHAVGIPYEIPAAVAADGIDEFLMWFAGDQRPDAEPVGGSVHLHCTDIDDHIAEGSDDRSAAIGEWLVTTLDGDGATFTREHAKGDAAVRGPSHDLLMWLWRRPAGPVEIIGDDGVAERFQAFSDL